MRLHVRKINVVILTPETADIVFEQEPILVSRIFHPGRSYECSPVHTTGGSLTCRRYLLALLTGNKEESKGFMVLRVKPTSTVIILRWTTHPCILYQVCVARVHGGQLRTWSTTLKKNFGLSLRTASIRLQSVGTGLGENVLLYRWHANQIPSYGAGESKPVEDVILFRHSAKSLNTQED